MFGQDEEPSLELLFEHDNDAIPSISKLFGSKIENDPYQYVDDMNKLVLEPKCEAIDRSCLKTLANVKGTCIYYYIS